MTEFKENTGEEFADNKYEELVGKYVEYKKNEKHFKDLKDEIVNEIDQMLHLEKKDYKKVFVNTLNENFECKYVDRITKKTDYGRLSEVVSDAVYNEIISEKTSTYLKIGSEAKPKIKRERPIEKDIDVRSYNEIPKAKILNMKETKLEAFKYVK